MSLAGVQVGDEIVLTDANIRAPWRKRVTAIGRKYATIGGARFDIETGVVADRWGHCRAYTVAAWERERAQEDFVVAVQRLDGLLRMDLGPVTTEQIREAERAINEIRAKIEGHT